MSRKQVILLKTRADDAASFESALHGITVDGARFVPRDTSSVNKICGDIGAVYPPIEYARFPFARVYILWRQAERGEKVLIAYAAVRFDTTTPAIAAITSTMSDPTDTNTKPAASFVVDAFGVLPSQREAGIGSRFYKAIKQDMSGTWKHALQKDQICGNGSSSSNSNHITVSIQSTFEHGSYVEAISKHTHKCKGRRSGSVVIDMEQVAAELRGSCCFWAKMGFANRELVCNRGGSVLSPILLMWHNL